MSRSRKVLIPAIVVGAAVSIALGIYVAYAGSLVGGTPPEENDGNNGNGGITGINDGSAIESCEPAASDPSSAVDNSDSGSESTSTNIGNPIGAEPFARITFLTLKNPEEKVSLRFTAKYTGEIQSLAINVLMASGNQSSFRAGLQEDNSGRPSGEWIGQPEDGNNQTDRNRFVTINIVEPAQLLSGKVYHLVIEATEPAANVSNEIRVTMYDVFARAQPLNDDNPDIPWPDERMNALYYDGTIWEERNAWPIFVVKYSDGRAVGQPYSLAAPWVIYGLRHTGQEIVPTSNYVLEKFGFSVAAKGKPSDNLCYEIRDSNNKVLAKGLFAEPDELILATRFFEVKLDSPLMLEKDKLYRVALYSPGTELDEPYHIYGHEFSYDSKIGYGGLRNILTASYDGGSTWHRWEDADTIFSLTAQKN